MKRYRSLVIKLSFFVFFLLIAGCASSELVDIWSDSDFQSVPLNKFLVISGDKNQVQRRLWEDAFSVELEKHHVAATPSYRLFPAVAPDTDQVIFAVNSNGFDGVIVTHRLPPETNPEYVQGYSSSQQVMRYDRRRSRFVTYYREVGSIGYVDSQKVYINAIDVWSIKNDGMMIWSAISKTIETNSEQFVRPEIAKLVMTELTNRGIIASKK